MKIIPLPRNKEAIVCDCHYDLVKNYKWSSGGPGYAMASIPSGHRNPPMITMHRLVNNTPKTMHTDHINGNKLDNRCVNLRSCTNYQNNLNKSVRKDSASGVKGVTLVSPLVNSKNPYWAHIGVDGKRIHLGYYPTLKLATKARKEAEIKYHGEFVRV